MDPKEFDQRQERVTELLGTVDETLDTIASQVTLLGNLHSPKAPAAILAHAGSAGASQWVETRCGRMKTASETLKAMAKKARDIGETLANSEYAIGHLCRDIAQPQLDLDLSKPLVQSVAQAAAEAGHQVPVAKAAQQIPWQKIRLWAEADGRLGAAELHGRDRLEALHDMLLDGCGHPGAWTCPPWLATKGDEEDEGGGDVLIDGRPVFIGDVLQVDDTLIFWGDRTEISEAGLEHLLGSEGPESEPDPGNPEPEYVGGKVRFRRRAKGTTLTADDLAYLDGIVAYEIVEVSRFGDYTNYTIERTHLPPREQPQPGLGVLDPDPTDSEGDDAEPESEPAAPVIDPLSITCPLSGCNATVGNGCKNYKGKPCAPHADRVKAAKRAAQPPTGRRAKKGA